MFLLTLLVVCLAVVGLTMLIHAASAAPEGVEDEHGFYITSPGDSAVPVLPQHSLLTASDMVFFKH